MLDNGSQREKARRWLTRDPGQLPGTHSSIAETREGGDTQAFQDRPVTDIKHCHRFCLLRGAGHVRGLINIGWVANCLRAIPPGKLMDRSLCPESQARLSLRRSGPNLPQDSSAATWQGDSRAQGEGGRPHRFDHSVPVHTRRYWKMSSACNTPAHKLHRMTLTG